MGSKATTRMSINMNDLHHELKKSIRKDIDKREKAEQEKGSILRQTIFLGTLGIMFVLPVIFGAYLGVWLDNKLHGFSMSWTISLILVGVFVGILNVYFFIKEK